LDIQCFSRDNQTINKDEFTLLYSTLGYELNGTKRALLRTSSPIDSSYINVKKSVWQVIKKDEKKVMEGSLKYLGITWGIQLWEIDFTDIMNSGS